MDNQLLHTEAEIYFAAEQSLPNVEDEPSNSIQIVTTLYHEKSDKDIHYAVIYDKSTLGIGWNEGVIRRTDLYGTI